MAQRDADFRKPLRPSPQDLEAIEKDVSDIPNLQQTLLEKDKDLHRPDRVAHQYQIAGSKVILRVAEELPEELRGVGLFEPGTEHVGIGRISTGLGGPHAEFHPDFLGLMLAFQTRKGKRVDFLAINDPSSPADDHHAFMDLLRATGELAGDRNFFVEQIAFTSDFAKRRGARAVAHVVRQTARTSLSSTAYQTYWTGIVEVRSTAAKFSLVPVRDENRNPGISPGERHLTEEWARRQAKGDIEFHLDWIPFLSERKTPTEGLTEPWKEGHKKTVGTVIFPKADLASEEQRLWATLASEMGANPGNWVHDEADSIPEPATRFGVARKIAYGMSQKGRNALDPQFYQEVFVTGEIGEELAKELRRRREEKERERHVSSAPI
ncbi:MAG TPA: hypothetical protein VE685_18825 [Thermoanaerobaculia bacterium]|nr:hypothetical protein [Thermoanaerobaculia bacterium]